MRIRGGFFCWLFVAVLAVSTVPAAELPMGYRLEPVILGLTEPTALAATPDGWILIGERVSGHVRYVRWGELQPDPLCAVTADATGTGGLLGISVHPDYGKNGWVYLYFTDSTDGNNKVVRYTVEGTACHMPFPIVSGLGGGPTGKNNGGGIGFGPDGKLYVSTGDMEVSANGQDTGVIQAKVLRLNDDGTIPADNPTAGSAIYAIGVRDPRGLTVNVAGQVYVTDSGTFLTADDEISYVPEDGNLGWADESGMGGVHDHPLAAWQPVVGIRGIADYEGTLYPEADADGLDNDNDSYGPDEFPGVKQSDDNGLGECIGGIHNTEPCANTLDCLPGRASENTPICDFRDDHAEYCDVGGTTYGDDDCDDVGTAGIDEPDESFLLDVFAAMDNGIGRAVLIGANNNVLNQWDTFLDATALDDCPRTWTDVMSGRDGMLYALATNRGMAGQGGLYRIVHDTTAGPREVSGPKSYVPLRVQKTGASTVDVYWEDLRDDSKQGRNTGTAVPSPLPRVREYSVWKGTIGVWNSHAVVANGVEGTEVNDVVRKQSVFSVDDENVYFIVSGRGDNLEGTLGSGEPGERAGYAVTDLCDTIGEWKAPWTLFTCAQEVTLYDTHERERTLSSLRGRAVWIDLPAEWCGPCITQSLVMEEIYQEYKDRGVAVITLLNDEEINGQDWDGRPTTAECRQWADQPGNIPDHTFECWADPMHCTGNPCSGNRFQEGWPKFNAHGAYPTNAVVDQGGEVVWSGAGWSTETTIRARLNVLVGFSDVCLH